MGDIEASPQPKKWILNAFSMSTPTHVASGLWRHPRNQTSRYTDIQYWLELAKILEGNFHALFLADMLGIYDVYKGPGNIKEVLPGAAQFPISDPSLPIAAMASVTKSLSFGITASTTYEPPFMLARRYSTLDHLTSGRVAINVVTSYLDSAAKNLGLEKEIPHDERYAIAEENLTVFYKLLEGSWRDDAVIRDVNLKQYTHPDRVRRIDHKGKYFSCAGPHQVEPSRQRTPFIFQAGASKAGKSFATRHSEAITAEQGRNPDGIKLIAGILIIVDETDEKAQARYEEYLSYADLDGSLALFGGWTGQDLGTFKDDDDLRFSGPGTIQSITSSFHNTIPGSDGVRWTKARVARELALGGAHPRAIGSASTVADLLQTWIDGAGIDGFNISYAVGPGDLEDVVKYLIPELKKRGVFWDAKAAEGKTTRENYLGPELGNGGRLANDHPGSAYKWAAS
ncbi:Dimethyl-sulfide monooxygenase [Neonectria ditissima]|uniref:Dimethyl-sulfide monooxygenase n=1 Tax=Neonectria ditissima TaxID=78410 RepID=A0A0P7AW98_9HYPO|nr:Dimethyl-sulfide monooxygenase [Neonectria ditissima]